MMFRNLLNVIEKVIEGKLTDDLGNEYRYVGFLVTEDELEKYKKAACKVLADYVDDELRMEDIPEKEREEVVKKVAMCLLDPYEALRKYGIYPDYYLPSVRDVAAQFVLSEALSEVKDAPTDAQAAEEVAYNLPEFSLYWGADARSYTGRWAWSGADVDVCWKLIEDEEVCKKIIKEQDKMWSLMHRRERETGKPYTWLFAVWEE